MKGLKEWCERYRALARTEELFWRCFQLYKEEEPEEFSENFPEGKENVRIEFEKIVYEVMLPDYDQEFISIYLNIFVNEDNVGWFKNMLLTDGADFDEFFVIE